MEIVKDTNYSREVVAYIESKTEEGVYYKMGLEDGKEFRRFTCTCKAGQNGKNCKHIDEFRGELGL